MFALCEGMYVMNEAAHKHYEELQEKEQKRKWHDLRVNSKDLPKLGTRVEVVLADKKTGEIEDNYFTRYGMGNPFGRDLLEVWIPPYQYCFYDNEIIAWREIERFEEVAE